MTRAHIGLGANLGDPVRQLREAIHGLACLGPVRVSSLYRSEPLGSADQPWYVNAVAELETELEPLELLSELRALEQAAGRPERRGHWLPRLLDLDLLLVGDRVLEGPELSLPHPGLARRRFVLEPLAELDSHLVEPRSGRRVGDLLRDLKDPLRVEKLPATLP